MQKEGLITPELHTEWITFRAFLSKKAEDDIAKQLKELVTNEMLITTFPNLSKIASICLTIPASTASVERSFSEMKLIKTRLRKSLSEGTLSQLMRIGIEAPEKLTDDDLDAILGQDKLYGAHVNIYIYSGFRLMWAHRSSMFRPD